jgi:hypothetical protein
MGPGSTGLPLGLQVAGKAGHDRLVLRVGAALQSATDWHRTSQLAPSPTPPVRSTRAAVEIADEAPVEPTAARSETDAKLRALGFVVPEEDVATIAEQRADVQRTVARLAQAEGS